MSIIAISVIPVNAGIIEDIYYLQFRFMQPTWMTRFIEF